MRNLKAKNVKGFTLVELIVVMAIIGVLAAILIPTMLGFMRDAKITQANGNAKTAFNAASAVLTKHCVDNPGVVSAAITMTAGSLTAITLGTQTYNFQEYLDGFKGEAVATTSATGTSIANCWWRDTSGGSAPSDFTKAKQETQARSGDLYGIYPIA